MNYRKYYEEMTQTPVAKDFEIHHIDMNRNNNNIKNLVMLPKELHQKYHKALNKLNYIGKLDKKITSVVDGGNGVNDIVYRNITEFLEIWKECNEWNDYKYYLLGIIPNITSIRYKGEMFKNE